LEECGFIEARLTPVPGPDAEALASVRRIMTGLAAGYMGEHRVIDRAAELLGSATIWFGPPAGGIHQAGAEWLRKDIAALRTAVKAYYPDPG
jgi:hypothetical protein